MSVADVLVVVVSCQNQVSQESSDGETEPAIIAPDAVSTIASPKWSYSPPGIVEYLSVEINVGTESE